MSSIKQILGETSELDGLDHLSIELWLAYLIGKDRLFVFQNPEFEVSQELLWRFWCGVDVMIEGKPLAQLTGTKEFYGLDFMVNESVLIPRPESELLVERTLEFVAAKCANLEVRVADIGTGSGAILLAVLKHLPRAKGIGTEISGEALEVAQKNAEALGLADRVNFYQGDLMEPVQEKCEIVLANLPYIGTERFNFVARNVDQFEPAVALYGGNDGLDHYRRMFEQLRGGGWFPDLLMGEFGFGQQSLMEELLGEFFPERRAEVVPDLAGIPRVFVLTSQAD